MVDDKDVMSKMFVGGLSWDTSKEGLQSYFCRFGEIVDCVVMINEHGRSRGFGFVTFRDPEVVQVVCRGGPHRIDNRVVDPKPCNPRGGPGKGGGKVGRGRGYPKIFVGGLPTSLTEAELKQFFQDHYGDVFEVVIMYDQERRKSRGFGFVSFENEEAVDRACRDHYVSINGKQVECKRAQPRDVLEAKMGGPGSGGPPMRGGPGGDFGGGYGGYPTGPGGPPQQQQGGHPGSAGAGDFRNGGFGGWGAPQDDFGGPPPAYSGGYGPGPQAGPWGAPPGPHGASAPHAAAGGWNSSAAAPQNPAAGGYGPGGPGGPPGGYGAPVGPTANGGAPSAATGYGGYGAPPPAQGYGPPAGPPGGPGAGHPQGPAPPHGYPGYPPAAATASGAPPGAAGPGAVPPNGYNGMGGTYGQDASSYGPTGGAYESYSSAYSAPAAPGTERTNGAALAPPGAAGAYHPYRR